jgi:hypothetical protein
MKTSHRFFVLAVLVSLPLVCWSVIQTSGQEKGKGKDDGTKVTTPAPPIPKWEYTIITGEKDTQETLKALNRLGDEGWELTGTSTNVSSPARPQGSGPVSSDVKLILKRRKQ